MRPRMFSVDLRSLGAFRVALGCTILYDLLARLRDFEAHYLDTGFLPVAAVTPAPWATTIFSPHLLNGSAPYQAALFALSIACVIPLIVGYRTRAALVLTWFLHASLRARNPDVSYSADLLLSALMFWSLFLPVGARFSLDAVNRRGAHMEETHYSTGAAALLLQVCMVFFFAGLHKLVIPEWRDGSMLALALEDDWYVTDVGRALQPFHRLTMLLTWGTLFIEVCIPLAIIAPHRFVRSAGLCAMFVFQLSMTLCMHLGLFPFAFMTALLPFIPGAFWDRIAGRQHTESGSGTQQSRSSWINRLVVGLLSVCLLFNVASLNYELLYERLPLPLIRAAGMLGLDQDWSMFTEPIYEDGWFVVQGTLKDGAQVNLLNPDEPFTLDKPPSVAKSMPSNRWVPLMQTALLDKNAEFWRWYVDFETTRWNAMHTAEQQLERVVVLFFHEPIPAGDSPVIRREVVWPLDFVREEKGAS